MKLTIEVPTHPLPRRFGLAWSTSRWNVDNRHGAGALNTVHPESRGLKNVYGGFRLARSTLEESWTK